MYYLWLVNFQIGFWFDSLEKAKDRAKEINFESTIMYGDSIIVTYSPISGFHTIPQHSIH